jgi:hypothetical protein
VEIKTMEEKQYVNLNNYLLVGLIHISSHPSSFFQNFHLHLSFNISFSYNQFHLSNYFFTIKAQMEDGLCMSIKLELGALNLELKA